MAGQLLLNQGINCDYLSWSGGMLTSPAFTNMSSTFQQNTINANIDEGNAGPNGSYDVNNARGAKNCN